MHKYLVPVFLFSALSLAAVPDFAEFLEADANVVFQVRSFSELRGELETHPLADLFENPELQAFVAPSFALDAEDDGERGFGEVLQEEFGLNYDDLFELIPGQACCAIYGFADVMFAGMGQGLSGPADPEVLFMFEFSGDAERLDELMQIQFERNAKQQQAQNPLIEHEMVTEVFMGETLYFDERFDGEETVVEDGYALVDGIFVLAAPEERLRMAVESIKEGANQPLSDAEYYLRAKEAGGVSDLSLFLNLGPMMDGLDRALTESPAVQGLAMVGLSPR